jgi:hypothetical protein
VEARFSAPVQTGPGTHPASYTMSNLSFPSVKRLERGVDFVMCVCLSVCTSVLLSVRIHELGFHWKNFHQKLIFEKCSKTYSECVISDLRRDLDEIKDLMCCYAVCSGKRLPTFWDNLLVSSLGIKKSQICFIFGNSYP